MFGQLAHGSGVGFLSSLREAAELQTLDHSLSQFGHGYTSGWEKLNSLLSWTESQAVYRSVAGRDSRERMIGLLEMWRESI
jgi:hypothetical protein